MRSLKREVAQISIDDVYMEEERRTLALSYLISNLFEAENLDECLDIAIKGLAMLDFFQSQINLLEDGYFLVKRNHMNKKYQFLLEKIGGRRFLGQKIDARSSFASHLLDSKIVTTLDIKDAVKVKLEDIIKGYLPREWRASKRLGVIARVVSVLPRKMNLLILPLIYRGKVIGGLGVSGTSLVSGDVLFLRNVCELFAQAFEKVQTKDNLRESEKKYRELIEGLYEGIWVIDKDAYTTFVNSRMAEMLAYTVDEMQGKHLFSFMDEQGVEIAKRNLERRKRGIEEEHDFEFLRKDGTRVYTRLATSPLTNAQGDYIGAIAGVIDITDRKKIEEEIRKLSSAVDQSIDGIAIGDLEPKLTYVNNTFAEIHGYSPEEMIGMKVMNLHNEQQMDDYKRGIAQIKTRGSWTGEIGHVKKDGKPFPTYMSVTLLKSEDGKPTGILAVTRDITERKKVEEEMIRLSSAVKISTDSIVISDLDAKIIDVNEATLKMYGTDDKGDLIGKNSFDLIAPEDREKALAGTKETLEKGYLESREYNIITKDGSRIPVEMSVAIMKDVNRKPIGFVAISRDISERKWMEEALAKSEEKFRSIFESASDCMIFLDRSGRILDVNRKAVEVFGGSKKELVGKHFTKVGVFSPRDIPTLMSSFAKGLADKRSAQDVRIKNRKGQEIPLECSASLLKMAGKFAGMLIIARDIAERKKAEEKLRASEEKYRSIVELAPDSIMTFDLKGVITSVNTASTRLSGYSKDELVGKHFSKAGILRVKDIPKYLKMLPSTVRGKVPAPFEVTYRCKDGTLRLGEVHMSLMREKSKIVGIQAIMRDITQRKQMEERYRDLVENEKDIIYTLDGKGNITFSSPAVEAVLGYQSEEVVGKNFMALIPEEWQAKTGADFNNLLKTGEITAETVLLSKKGQARFVEYSSTVIKEGNKVVGTRGIVRDITKRKKMEEALKLQRDIAITLSGARDLIEALNRLFDNLLEIEEFDCAGFYLVDKDTGELDMITYRGLPDGFVEKVGHLDADSPYARVVMEEKPIYQKTSDFPPAIREDLQSDGILAVAAIPIQYEGEVIGDLNLASHTHDEISASTRHVLESVAAHIGETIVRARIEEKLRESEEKLRQYSEHLEELVQKRTEELLESEKRYSVLVEEARDGVAILQDAKIVFANKRGTEIFGYSREELIGLPFEKLLDEKYRQLVKERYMRRLRGEEVPPTYEIEIIAKNGERIPVEISATLIHHQGRPADLVIVRDIRERKRMEAERLRLEKLVTIGELATMVGHDLRNPLQAIENATYYLNNELSRFLPSIPISPKATEVLQALNDSVNYADKIVRDLQDFATKKQPMFKKTNINTIVKEALSHLKTPENVKLITKLRGPPEIEADKNMIKRTFLNLAINGIQAMENGGRLKVSTKKKKGFVEISFKDTGIGISQEDIGKIFTPFFTTRAKGMGMGLPICKKFVEAHGGSIHVESQEGKGSTFTVKLPIQQESGGENP